MSSPIERLPPEVLQLAALYCIQSHSPLSWLNDLVNLLLTSRTIHASISLSNCTHLYSQVFRWKFDMGAISRRHPSLTNTALTFELVRRCMALRRIRRRQFPPEWVRQDLWIVLCMMMESDELNFAHLQRAGVADYLVQLLQSRSSGGWPRNDATSSLACSCLLATLTHGDVREASARTRILQVLRPYTLNILRGTDQYASSTTSGLHLYGEPVSVNTPGATYLAVRLSMTLIEGLPLQGPHSDTVSSSTIAKKDGALLSEGDIRCTIHQHGEPAPPSLRYDGVFSTSTNCSFPYVVPLNFNPHGHKGDLGGDWQGTYLVAPFSLTEQRCQLAISPDSEFIARESLECHLVETQTQSAQQARDSSQSQEEIFYTGVTGDYEWEGSIGIEGLVKLRRKSVLVPSEIWLFEGHLYTSTLIVGRWTSGATFADLDRSLSGIFVLHKVQNVEA